VNRPLRSEIEPDQRGHAPGVTVAERESHRESDEGRAAAGSARCSSGSTAPQESPPSPSCRTSSARHSVTPNRISLDGKRDFFLTLSRGINELVDAIGGVVEEVQGLVAAANQGDLTHRIVTEGKAGLMVKIGSGINDLTDNLSGLVSQVKAAALAVSRGADEISQGNANLSQRTEEQASSLEETASSMEEMTSTVKQNADNAAQANQLGVAARDQAEKGGAVVAKAVRSMADINDASKKINDIIGVIDEIAFHLLGAECGGQRARRAGCGFAVVASGARSRRTCTAARAAPRPIQDSAKVNEGTNPVVKQAATPEQIVTVVKKVTDIVAEIAAASNR
jgi:methyl-accepting chemotaxis protein